MKQGPFLKELSNTLGIESTGFSLIERLLAACGAAGSLCLCVVISAHLTGFDIPDMLVTSLGASAVLVFTVPHGAMSQPWPLVVGHAVCALVGVSVYKLLGFTVFSACMAVGLSILLMTYTRSIHPPGGATALYAVIGGDAVHQLGFHYLLCPIALNVALLLICAITFNWFFEWRRYPTHWFKLTRVHSNGPIQKGDNNFDSRICRDDLIYARDQLDSFVDITIDDLELILGLANEHRAQKRMKKNNESSKIMRT
ncbi:HPP family protein [Bermanella marisrubri]|nr:HPP family protein [Bermanella marisrubri]